MEFSSPRNSRNPSLYRSTPNKHKAADEISDDELSVISQSPYFETQPTQILERPTLALQSASSPASKVEVPVSSPCRPLKELQKGSRLATTMASVGTSYKPPPTVEFAGKFKRAAIEIPDSPPRYTLSSDSEDDTPARADIKPSSFGPKEPKQVIDLTEDKPTIVSTFFLHPL